jgi:hypothetical protein
MVLFGKNLRKFGSNSQSDEVQAKLMNGDNPAEQRRRLVFLRNNSKAFNTLIKSNARTSVIALLTMIEDIFRFLVREPILFVARPHTSGTTRN